jgi:hypothetical protein
MEVTKTELRKEISSMRVSRIEGRNEGRIGVTLFDKTSWRSDNAGFEHGDYDCKKMAFFNDRTESIIVEKGF